MDPHFWKEGSAPDPPHSALIAAPALAVPACNRTEPADRSIFRELQGWGEGINALRGWAEHCGMGGSRFMGLAGVGVQWLGAGTQGLGVLLM